MLIWGLTNSSYFTLSLHSEQAMYHWLMALKYTKIVFELFAGYSTVKTKDRGFVETVPQLAVKGVGYVAARYVAFLSLKVILKTHLEISV